MSIPMSDLKKHMEKAIEFMKSEFSKMRVGRASATMIEGVKVDCYGSMMTMKEVAALSVPDAKTITIQPWDRSLINEIEKGILAANLGLTPMNDGKLIRITLPQMTEERRKDFVKLIKKEGEDAKVALRNIRRDCMEWVKKTKEDGKLSEDDQRSDQEEIQKTTDHFSAEVDKLVEIKSKEVMSL